MYLRVKDLIEELKTRNPESIIVVTDAGKDHQYGIKLDDIDEMESPYFGNDMKCEEYFNLDLNDDGNNTETFLNLGYF